MLSKSRKKKDEGTNKLEVISCTHEPGRAIYDDLIDGKFDPPVGWRVVSISVVKENAYILLEKVNPEIKWD